MLKKTLLILMMIFIYHANYAFDWPYDDNYTGKRLYLHGITNYAYDQSWKFEWEKNYLKKNSAIMNFGSVATDKLLCDMEVLINHDLGKGWKFFNHLDWYATRHRNEKEYSNFMGLEKIIFKKLSIFWLFNPYYDKDKIDMQFGFSIADSDYEKYLRLALVTDDFVYESKNEEGGKSIRKPLGLEWRLRTGIGQWWFYSEGKLTTGFKRELSGNYNDPEITVHEKRVNDQLTKLYYRPSDKMLFEVYSKWYQFYESKNYLNPDYNFTYENNIYQNGFRSTIEFTNRIQFRYTLHYLYQHSVAEGFREYEYNRNELFFPSAFIDYSLKRNVIYLGYFGTNYRWKKDAIDNLDDFSNRGYSDKIILGWKYKFPESGKIKISISHSTTYHGFGGANVQFITNF
jgi:hypothetical protein